MELEPNMLAAFRSENDIGFEEHIEILKEIGWTHEDVLLVSKRGGRSCLVDYEVRQLISPGGSCWSANHMVSRLC